MGINGFTWLVVIPKFGDTRNDAEVIIQLFSLPKADAKSEVDFGKNSRWNPNIGAFLHLVETIVYEQLYIHTHIYNTHTYLLI